LPLVPLLVLLGTVGTAPAETLQECLEQGLKSGRNAQILKAELDKQRATLGMTRAEFQPKATVSQDSQGRKSVRLADRLSSRTQVSASLAEDEGGARSELVSLSQSVFVGNAVELARARLQWQVARLQYEQGLEDFKFSLIRKFYEVVRAQERIKTLQESVERWSRALTFAEVKFTLGTTNKIDVLNTKVNQGTAENALLAEQQSLARVGDELKDLIGVELTRPLTATESLDFSKVETNQVSLERREVAADKLKVELARVNLRDARQRSRPDVRLDTSYRSSRGNAYVVNDQLLQPTDSEVVAALSYNFQLGKRADEYDRDRLVRELDSTRLALENQRVAVEREHRDILRSLELKERAIRTATESLDQARESYDFSLEAFQKGMISSLDLRDSQDKLTQARDSLTSLLIDYRIARYQYVKVLGGTL
jgi:outer membrane protein TolC